MKSIFSLTILAALAAGSIAAGGEPVAQNSTTVTLGESDLLLGIPGNGPLTEKDIKAWLAIPGQHQELTVKLPLGLSLGENQMKGLQETPMTRAKIELGRQLYFDTRLSSDNTVSCATCHHPQQGFTRHTQFGIGVEGQEGGRNSPVSYNRILSDLQFWDGRAASLEEQAVGPIANPIEMANTHEQSIQTIKKIAGYVLQFEAVFPDSGVTIENVGKALATFERAIVTGPSPYDYRAALKPFESYEPEDIDEIKEDDPDVYQRYQELTQQAAKNPMSESAVRGQVLFFDDKIGCTTCHVGANFADEKYHNLGIGMNVDQPDLGRFEITGDEKDKGAFKTPTIRNTASTGPFMHDGSLRTLEEVVEHYNKGGTKNPWLSDKIVPLNLTNQQKLDLVEFMRACSGPFPTINTGRLPE